MKYVVIELFHDLQDKNHEYKKGDTFPREGCTYEITDDRLAELSGSGNKRGIPLISAVEEPAAKPPKKPAAKKGK